MTTKPIQMFLQLNRSVGTICEFIGIDKRNYSPEDQKSLDDAVSQSDEAMDFLQKYIYALNPDEMEDV